MNSDRLYVIARYNENLNWIEKISGKTIIYNKGQEFPFSYSRIDIPNIGRECETFVRAIVENYEILNTYDSIAFLQGNPFDHCPEIIEGLNSIDNQNFYGLSLGHRYEYMPNTDQCLFGRNKIIFEKYINKNITPIKYLFYNNFEEKVFDFSDEFEQMLILLDILKINYFDKTIKWAAGAQYSVPVKYILYKDLNWWTDFLSLIHLLWTKHNWNRLAHVVEKIWPLIWEHKTK